MADLAKEQAKEAGIELPPEPDEDSVKIYADLVWVWNAFWRLAASREVGFDRPYRIKLSEVKAYADLHRLTPCQAQTLLFYVDQLDARWMHHADEAREESEAEKRKKNNDHTPGRAKRPSSPPRH